MTSNDQRTSTESSPESGRDVGSRQLKHSSEESKAIGCVAIILVFLLPALIIFLVVKSCGPAGDGYGARNIKLRRYHTVDFDWETHKYLFLDWYVLNGDDCYYVSCSDLPKYYSELQWKKLREFPQYLLVPARKGLSGIAPVVKDLPYTLIPVTILPDSIQVNLKEQLKQNYEMPVPNDFDEQVKDRDRSDSWEDHGEAVICDSRS